MNYTYGTLALAETPKIISEFKLKEIAHLGNEDNTETKNAGHVKLLETCPAYSDYFKGYVESIIPKDIQPDLLTTKIFENMLDLSFGNEP